MVASAEKLSALLLRRAPWDAVDSSFAARIPFDSPSQTTDDLVRRVRDGVAVSHQLIHNGSRCGLVITEVEHGSAGRELVVVSAFSDSPEPLSDALAEAMEAIGRAEQCVSIRFHTIRPAAARYAAERHGFRLTELVMRKTLSK